MRKRGLTPFQGFTLIELMVSLVIAAAIAGAVMGAVAAGFRLWGRIQEGGAADRDAVFALETLARQLRQSVSLPERGYAGKPDSFYFVQSDGAAITGRGYRFDAMSGQLLAGSQPLADVREKKALEPSEPFLAGVQNLTFSYLPRPPAQGEASWSGSWEEKDGVPAAVRVEGSRQGRAFSRTVLIPRGVNE